MSRFSNENEDVSNYLKTTLEKTYGEGNVDIISASDTITLKINQNGTSRFYEYNLSTNVSKALQPGINYGGKYPSEIQPGDDITIVTEKFKVFAVENNKIKAMPYYNITLTETPLQSKDAAKTKFSTGIYWEEGEDAIDTDNPQNLIHQYIISYKTTLEIMGASILNIRAPRYNELNKEGISGTMINPGGNGDYWIASVRGTEYAVYQLKNVSR